MKVWLVWHMEPQMDGPEVVAVCGSPAAADRLVDDLRAARALVSRTTYWVESEGMEVIEPGGGEVMSCEPEGVPPMEFLGGVTSRGFARLQFNDLYGQQCSAQDSSLADKDAVWLGVDKMLCSPAQQLELAAKILEAGPRGRTLEVHARMHLTRPQAREIIKLLQRFVDTGSVG